MQELIDFKNVHDMILSTVQSKPDRAVFRWRTEHNELASVTCREFYRDIRAAARSLMKLGVKKGDRVGIISYSNYRWVQCDLAILSMGASTVGIYHSLPGGDIGYIIGHSGVTIVFAEDGEQVRKILSVIRTIPRVKKIILMKGEYEGKGKNKVLSFDEFIALGATVQESRLDGMIKAVRPGDLASIIYTSGTSGAPKGVMLTHDNIIFTSQLVKNTVAAKDGDETLLFLPLAHVFARIDVYASILITATLAFSRAIETVPEDLKMIRPHWFPGVPRIFEKVYIKIRDGVRQKGPLAVFLLRWALGIGYRRSELVIARKRIPVHLRARYAVATKLIFKKIHTALGGRIDFCVCGAAPFNQTVSRFFHAAGITILEGYGMTENASLTNVSTFEKFKFGSVGPAVKGVDMKIAGDGEILFRGRNIMKGYYKQPAETKKAIDSKGWLHTGDTGFVDDEGFLSITGRKKELIITSGGKNIAPSHIESLLLVSKYINQVCVVGDGRNYLSALITLNQDAIREYARKTGIQLNDSNELGGDQRIHDRIKKEVARVNRKLASYETIKRFAIVPEFTIENRLLTPTLKPKKTEILKAYKDTVEAMYE